MKPFAFSLPPPVSVDGLRYRVSCLLISMRPFCLLTMHANDTGPAALDSKMISLFFFSRKIGSQNSSQGLLVPLCVCAREFDECVDINRQPFVCRRLIRLCCKSEWPRPRFNLVCNRVFFILWKQKKKSSIRVPCENCFFFFTLRHWYTEFLRNFFYLHLIFKETLRFGPASPSKKINNRQRLSRT